MTLCSLLCVGVLALDAAPKSSPKVKKKKKGAVEAVDTVKKEKKDKYAEAIKDAKIYDGLIKMYMTPKEELLFEIREENY